MDGIQIQQMEQKVETPYMPASRNNIICTLDSKKYTITFNPGENATVDKKQKK